MAIRFRGSKNLYLSGVDEWMMAWAECSVTLRSTLPPSKTIQLIRAAQAFEQAVRRELSLLRFPNPDDFIQTMWADCVAIAESRGMLAKRVDEALFLFRDKDGKPFPNVSWQRDD